MEACQYLGNTTRSAAKKVLRFSLRGMAALNRHIGERIQAGYDCGPTNPPVMQRTPDWDATLWH